MTHITMGHGVSGCFGTSLAPMRSLKRGSQYRIRYRCLLRWARRLHPFRIIIRLLVKCCSTGLQGSFLSPAEIRSDTKTHSLG